MKPNGANERIKHRYFAWLRNAGQKSEKAIDQVAMALDRFEHYTARKDFRSFRVEQADAFKKYLATVDGKRSGTALSKATITSTLYALRDFVRWLADQKGFRGRLARTDADYFNPSRRDEAIARSTRPMKVPTIEQVEAMVGAMPTDTVIGRRNRAIVALIALTGARDDAVASLQMADLDLADRQLFHDPRHVRSKFRKTFSTWFFPVGDVFEEIVGAWKTELEVDHGFGPKAPLFPKTDVSFGPGGSTAPARLGSEGWSNADPIRKLFREACENAGLPDFRPHSFRHMLARLGLSKTQSNEELKVWSQNLGHEKMLTTLTSYGQVPDYRQRELILGMGKRNSS